MLYGIIAEASPARMTDDWIATLNAAGSVRAGQPDRRVSS